MDCSSPSALVYSILQGRTLEWVAFPPPRDLPDPGIEPVSLVPCAGRWGLFHCAPAELSQTFPLLALTPLVSLSHSACGSFPLFTGDFTAENVPC